MRFAVRARSARQRTNACRHERESLQRAAYPLFCRSHCVHDWAILCSPACLCVSAAALSIARVPVFALGSAFVCSAPTQDMRVSLCWQAPKHTCLFDCRGCVCCSRFLRRCTLQHCCLCFPSQGPRTAWCEGLACLALVLNDGGLPPAAPHVQAGCCWHIEAAHLWDSGSLAPTAAPASLLPLLPLTMVAAPWVLQSVGFCVGVCYYYYCTQACWLPRGFHLEAPFFSQHAHCAQRHLRCSPVDCAIAQQPGVCHMCVNLPSGTVVLKACLCHRHSACAATCLTEPGDWGDLCTACGVRAVIMLDCGIVPCVVPTRPPTKSG